jgi:hypothetical protein
MRGGALNVGLRINVVHSMLSIKIMYTSVCSLYDWLLPFKYLPVSGTWSDGSGSGISDIV